MNRSRAFPIVIVVPDAVKTLEHGRQNAFLMGMCDGQLWWTDDQNMALRFSSAAAASLVASRIDGAKLRVAFA